MNLYISLRSELLKTKRTASIYLTVAAAAFGPFMSLLDIIFDGVEEEHRDNLFNEMFTAKFQMSGLVILPVFLILICTLLPQVEYRNNTWKQVLASPQTKTDLYIAKYINIHLLVLLFFLVNQLLMLLVSVIIHFKEPSLHVLQQTVNGRDMWMILFNSYVGILAVSAIQFWLGLRFKNFIIPVAIGIACWFIGTILVMQQSGLAAYFPYSFHAYGNFPKYNAQIHTVGWASFGYAMVFLLVGFIDFKRRGK